MTLVDTAWEHTQQAGSYKEGGHVWLPHNQTATTSSWQMEWPDLHRCTTSFALFVLDMPGSFKIKANPIHQWPCENSSHQCTECIWISTSLGGVTGMRTTVWPKSPGGTVGFVTIWSVSKAPGISCLLDNLLWVPVQTILTEIGIPSIKNSEVCKTHLQKLCCYLRVCIFLCCQVANLRYAEFNIRFRWLVRCWLNGENSRTTRS
jgi:hypothetical protein